MTTRQTANKYRDGKLKRTLRVQKYVKPFMGTRERPGKPEGEIHPRLGQPAQGRLLPADGRAARRVLARVGCTRPAYLHFIHAFSNGRRSYASRTNGEAYSKMY